MTALTWQHDGSPRRRPGTWLRLACLCIVGLCASVQALAQELPALAQPDTRAAPNAASPPAQSGGPSDGQSGTHVGTGSGAVHINQRHIVTFRATLLGDSPAERAEMASEALLASLAGHSAGIVSRTATGSAVRFELDGRTIFFLAADDLTGPRPEVMLDAAADAVERRLRLAMLEAREASDPRQWAWGAAWAIGATVLAYALIRLIFLARRRAMALLDRQLQRLREDLPGKSVMSAYAVHAQSGVRFAAQALTWGLVVLLIDLWLTFVLRQFAYTRPWGERSTAWLLDVIEHFALATARAVPGLLTAILIFIIARLATRANTLFMQRVERGELQVAWLDADTVGPTRRLSNFVVWLFALAMAYPYLPGADSEAFKGVTVLAGLMLSLGASGVVGQAMAGLSLMYSKSLRVGEYVKIGDTEGTVTAVGMLATKLHTGLGEEVSLPSAAIVGLPVRNFSRLVQDGQFMLHAAITIGYATPWRQVHAMLLEAAHRTAGVAEEPAPFVVQTALSDFYVEYRLCAQGNRSAPRRRIEAVDQLHAHIQDVFNENGVQIMSPHYIEDPAQPQVVPPPAWAPELLRRTPPGQKARPGQPAQAGRQTDAARNDPPP